MTNRKGIGSATSRKLDILISRLAERQALLEQVTEGIDVIRAEILELADRYKLPVSAGRSEYYLGPVGPVLRITRPSPPAPTLNAARFLDRVGPELFHELCLVRSADLDAARFRVALAEERVKESDLTDCLLERRASRPSVALTANLPVVGEDDPVDAGSLTPE